MSRHGVVKNQDTGATHKSLESALEEASANQTLIADLGAKFEGNVTIDVEGLTLEAEGDSRVYAGIGADLEMFEVTGKSQPTIDDDADVLILESKGKAEPTLTGDAEVMRVDARGKSRPRIEGDVDRLFLDLRGKAQPTISGNVEQMIVDARGRAEPKVTGNVKRTISGRQDSQPTIEGAIEIEANGITLQGFDVVAGDIGIDVGADDPSTVRLSNNLVQGTEGLSDNVETPPDDGVGIQVRNVETSGEFAVGGDEGTNILKDHIVGISAVDREGELAGANVRPLLANNRFVETRLAVLPRLKTLKEQPDPVVSSGPPVEVTTSEREAGETINARLSEVAIDDGETIRLLAVSVRLASGAEIEFAIKTEQPIEEPEVRDLYEAIDDGGFSVETSLEESQVAEVRFKVSVDRDAVDDPEHFSVQRRVDGEFQPLWTERLDDTPTAHQYRVHSPGFSMFQSAEFDSGGIGGPGRRIDGDLLMPEDDLLEEAFVRISSTEHVEDLEIEPTHEYVSFEDERLVIDATGHTEEALPELFLDLFTITNTGDRAASIWTSVGLGRAVMWNLDPALAIDEDASIYPELEGGSTDALADILFEPELVELDPGETTAVSLTMFSVTPAHELWVKLQVPTLVDEHSGEPLLGSDSGLGDDHPSPNCGNTKDVPVMYHKDASIEDGSGTLRVPAYLDVNWYGQSREGSEEGIKIILRFNEGSEGSLKAVDGFFIPGLDSFTRHTDDVTFPIVFGPETFGDGAFTIRFDMVFETDNPCEPGITDGELGVTDATEFDHVGALEFEVEFVGEENRWTDVTGKESATASAEYYTVGETAEEMTDDLVQEAFEIFAEGVLNAAMPGPVMTYRAARGMMGADSAGLQLVGMWSGIDGLTEKPLTPQSLITEKIVSGITGFSEGNQEEVPVPSQFELQGLDLGLFGPSLSIVDDRQVACVDADVRRMSIQDRLVGGPVVLMGLDSELTPGRDNHGPPEEHAAMVASILDSVTNGGDGILVLGGTPERNDSIVEYWAEDVGGDDRVAEEVNFVNGPNEIGEVDFDGYAMLGIVSSTRQIFNGLTASENEALIERQEDIAAFVNDGGGLLGNTQHGLDNSWEYISPVAEIEGSDASYSSIKLTEEGENLGFTTSGMDGWCCYHETFDEETIPDFLDVLLRNPEQPDNPPAAIGGEDVVVQTATRLNVEAPANVENGEPTSFVTQMVREDTGRGPDEEVRLEAVFTHRDGIGIHDVDIEERARKRVTGDTLTAEMTDPFELSPEQQLEWEQHWTFDKTGPFDVRVEIVGDESGQTFVQLPFGVRAVSEERGICPD